MWICRIWLPKGLHRIVTELKNRNAFSGKKEGVYGHLSMSRVKSLIFIALVEKNKIGQMLFEENYSLCSPPGSHVLAILFWRAGLCALWSKSSKYLRNNQYNNWSPRCQIFLKDSKLSKIEVFWEDLIKMVLIFSWWCQNKVGIFFKLWWLLIIYQLYLGRLILKKKISEFLNSVQRAASVHSGKKATKRKKKNGEPSWLWRKTCDCFQSICVTL